MSNPTDPTRQSTIDPQAARAASHAARLGESNHSDVAGAAAVLVPALEGIHTQLKRIADLMEDSAP